VKSLVDSVDNGMYFYAIEIYLKIMKHEHYLIMVHGMVYNFFEIT
jgi:hypothetical protein